MREQSGCALAADPAGAIHHYGFAVELFLGFRRIEPLRELVAVPHVGVQEFGPTLREVAAQRAAPFCRTTQKRYIPTNSKGEDMFPY